MNGILNILKPPGMTSSNVVSYIKRTLNVKKVGHTGTLDPGAAGVLPICIGKATRVSEYLLNDRKSYRAEMCLGFISDTLDKYGKVESTLNPGQSLDKIYSTFENYIGRIEQIPPMYSAVKYNGTKLYTLARQGIVIERKIREANIYDIKILKINGNNILFDVTCSKGTYIRTLISDIGKSLGSDAIMTFLLRTKTGPFEIKSAITLDELKLLYDNGNIDKVIYPAYMALESYSRVFIDESLSEKASNGVGFPMNAVIKYETRDYDDTLLIFDINDNFIATGKLISNNYIKIDKVFS